MIIDNNAIIIICLVFIGISIIEFIIIFYIIVKKKFKEEELTDEQIAELLR